MVNATHATFDRFFPALARQFRDLFERLPQLTDQPDFEETLWFVLNWRPQCFQRPLDHADRSQTNHGLMYLRNSPTHQRLVAMLDWYESRTLARQTSLDPQEQRKYQACNQGLEFILRCAARIADDCRHEAQAKRKSRPKLL